MSQLVCHLLSYMYSYMYLQLCVVHWNSVVLSVCQMPDECVRQQIIHIHTCHDHRFQLNNNGIRNHTMVIDTHVHHVHQGNVDTALQSYISDNPVSWRQLVCTGKTSKRKVSYLPVHVHLSTSLHTSHHRDQPATAKPIVSCRWMGV